MTKLIGIVIGLVLFITLPFFIFGEQIEQVFAGNGVASWLQDFGGYAWAAAIGLLVADLAIPVPTTAVMAALGMVYGPVLGGIIAGFGSIASGLVGYGLCRKLGRPFALWLSGEKGLAEGEKLFQNLGGWIVAMSRWLPVVSEVVACLAGLSKMPFPVFCCCLSLQFCLVGIFIFYHWLSWWKSSRNDAHSFSTASTFVMGDCSPYFAQI